MLNMELRMRKLKAPFPEEFPEGLGVRAARVVTGLSALDLLSMSEEDLLTLKGITPKSADEIRQALRIAIAEIFIGIT